MTPTEFPVLTVGDDAEERGRRHGERFAREIGENIAIYLERFAASGLDCASALAEGEAWDRVYRREGARVRRRDAGDRRRLGPHPR